MVASSGGIAGSESSLKGFVVRDSVAEACLTLPSIANSPERGCVQRTSRSTMENSWASGKFQASSIAKLLRLVCDTVRAP